MDKERTKINLQNGYSPPAGDFRSPECIELLKEADIVVTNPPFSLLREFLAQLMEYDKKFLIIGNCASVGCKEIFPFFKDNKIWLGISIRKGDREFRVANYDKSYGKPSRIDEKGFKYTKISGVRWFTNLKTAYKQPPLDMRGVYYTPEKYPKYDNYDAINVDKVANIPCDYPGIMGVPLTFMDKYCPEQFEIVGLDRYTVPKKDLVAGRLAINSKVKYARIFIKNKHPENSKQRDQLSQRIVLKKVFVAKLASNVAKKITEKSGR